MPNAVSTTLPRRKPVPMCMQQGGKIPSISRALTENEKRMKRFFDMLWEQNTCGVERVLPCDELTKWRKSNCF